MSQHSAIKKVVERVRTDVIGGAVDVSKEVIEAMSEMVQDSQAKDTKTLVAEVDDALLDIMRVMPAYVAAINALHGFIEAMERAEEDVAPVDEMKTVLKRTADVFFESLEAALENIAHYGAEKIHDGDTVFTYTMSSTIWRIFREAKSQGKSFSVIVTECRPENEGLWTVKEMEKSEISVSVSIDACIGELIPQCDAVFIGANVISSNGSVQTKAGAYTAALVAREHGVPFYFAADTLKFDSSSLIGLSYPNMPLHRHDVLDNNYSDNVQVIGHLFDETPPELVTAVITEQGFMHPTSAFTVLKQMQSSKKLNAMLPIWSRGEL